MKQKNYLKIILYKNRQNIIHNKNKNKLIKLYHNTPCGGHFGVRKTLLIELKQKYIWKDMFKMVKKFVSTCDLCQRNKQIRHTKEPLCITDTPTDSFSTIVIDTGGPLRPSEIYRKCNVN